MNFFITGTQAYGPVTTGSDIDIVMFSNDAEALWKILNEMGITPFQTEVQKNEKYGGFYFKVGPLQFNVIEAVTSDDYRSWFWATERMKKIDPIIDRGERLAKFKSFFTSEDIET
ncbi:MAG: hypothetical protein WBN66_03590 [Smithella sp.]